jgi:hypothetical protein
MRFHANYLFYMDVVYHSLASPRPLIYTSRFTSSGLEEAAQDPPIARKTLLPHSEGVIEGDAPIAEPDLFFSFQFHAQVRSLSLAARN